MLTSRILQRQGTKIHTTKSNKGQVGYVYLHELQQKDNTYKTGEAVSREKYSHASSFLQKKSQCDFQLERW